VYLYLKNKTFINAHLVKNGLVEVDTEKEYLYKNKFIKLSQRSIVEKKFPSSSP
jgi:site-specific DNA-methyltransferase (adenine-specific)